MTELIRVDSHNHTHYSPDSLTTPAELIAAARKAHLDRVAVTDHNAIKGALEAHKLAPELVIVGEEVMTTIGELLALFVKDYIPPFLSPLETISRLRQQGAFISVSHPFDPTRSGWSLADMEELVPLVDAIEVFNAH
ncbi:MAG: PHP domain-containing protein, partial [Anaerolineaceae bacterium]